MKIGITLTSSLNVGEEYINLTEQVLNRLAKDGYSIVYGGTAYGMMLKLAEAYKQAAGKELIGVMAKDLMSVTKGYVAYDHLDARYITETMGDRIAKIVELSDAFILMPGGYGAVEELAAIIGGKVNKLHDKPIAIYNYEGFYDTLIKFFRELYEKEFSKVKLENIVFVGKDLTEILAYFKNYETSVVPDKFV